MAIYYKGRVVAALNAARLDKVRYCRLGLPLGAMGCLFLVDGVLDDGTLFHGAPDSDITGDAVGEAHSAILLLADRAKARRRALWYMRKIMSPEHREKLAHAMARVFDEPVTHG